MDIKNVEDKLDGADRIIDKTWTILKKHWGKLIILAIIAIVLWFAMIVKDEVENPTIDDTGIEQIDDYYDDESINDE